MLMKPDKKKSVTLIMSRLGAQPEQAPTSPEDGVEQDDSIGFDTAASELLAAIKSDSPKAVVSAIKALVAMCEESEPEESEPEEMKE